MMIYNTVKRLAVLLIALSFALALPSETTAQTTFQVGPRLGVDIGDIEEPYIGVDTRITSAQLPVVINPTFDFYFVGEGASLWSLSGNVLYPFGSVNRTFTFYGGLGLSLYRYSVESGGAVTPFRDGTTDFGANFLFGTMIYSSKAVAPYAEIRYTPIFTEGGPSLFGITGGLLFKFGG